MQSVVNVSMLLFKIFFVIFKIKDRQGSIILFKDVFKNVIDNVKDINKKDNILLRKVLVGGYRVVIVFF